MHCPMSRLEVAGWSVYGTKSLTNRLSQVDRFRLRALDPREPRRVGNHVRYD